MVLPFLTFMVDPVMNLMSGPVMNVRGGSTIFRAPRVPKNYSELLLVTPEYHKCVLPLSHNYESY